MDLLLKKSKKWKKYIDSFRAVSKERINTEFMLPNEWYEWFPLPEPKQRMRRVRR